MENGGIKQLLYYQNQLLTEKDFTDQQAYHREKLKQFVRRFPEGIIRGLNVIFDSPKANDDFEAFKITEGAGVDEDGNSIIVSEEGIRIPISQFLQNKPKEQDFLYLSLTYVEKEIFDATSAREGVVKNNRVQESVQYSWDTSPNIPAARERGDGFQHITLAKVRLRKEGDPSEGDRVSSDKMLIIEEQPDPLRTLRKDASIIGTEQIADQAIIATKIAENAIETDKITDGAISTIKIEDNAVESSKIAENAVGPRELANDAISRDHIPDNAINADKIEDNAVESSKIAENAVGSRELANDAISRDHIPDNAINADKIEDNAVESSKIAEDAVGPRELANDAVSSDHISANAVTNEKLADRSVRASQIAADAVRNTQIQNGAVTHQKLSIAMELDSGTNVTDPTHTVTVQVEPEAMVHVIPTEGTISWSIAITAGTPELLDYEITITNEAPGSPFSWRVIKINFGQIAS